MKVKIGDTIYDANKQAIMLILSDADKKNIANMLPQCQRFCAAPENIPNDVIEAFMELPEGGEGMSRCIWTENDEGYMGSECGGSLSFEYGFTIREDYTYCPKCGKKIIVEQLGECLACNGTRKKRIVRGHGDAFDIPCPRCSKETKE